CPEHPAYDAGTGQVYVPNMCEDTVSVLPTLASVDFTVSGLPAGAAWSVELGGSSANSTGSSLSFAEPDGSFPFTVACPASYSASPPNGLAQVDGQNLTIAITCAVPGTLLTLTFHGAGL